jgi:hypothetical protein
MPKSFWRALNVARFLLLIILSISLAVVLNKGSGRYKLEILEEWFPTTHSGLFTTVLVHEYVKEIERRPYQVTISAIGKTAPLWPWENGEISFSNVSIGVSAYGKSHKSFSFYVSLPETSHEPPIIRCPDKKADLRIEDESYDETIPEFVDLNEFTNVVRHKSLDL